MFEDAEDYEYVRDTMPADHEPVWPHTDFDYRYLGLETEEEFLI
jgi:hypothetical protein